MEETEFSHTIRSHQRSESKIPSDQLNNIRIVGYSDAAFANNSDMKSQLGRIILLTDCSNSAIPIVFKSYKSRRVARSVLSAEVIAFADLFDDALALKSQIEHALQQTVTVHLLTDSKSLFDIISRGSRTSEKRIMLDLQAAREGHEGKEISNIGFFRSSKHLADGLNKEKSRNLYSISLKVESIRLIVNNGSYGSRKRLSPIAHSVAYDNTSCTSGLN